MGETRAVQVSIDVNQQFPNECRFIDYLSATSLKTGTIAPALRTMLVAHQAGIISPQFEPNAVFQTIKSLEGVNREDLTKGPFQYKNGLLAGLWRKHFFQPSFMPANILAAMSNKKGLGRFYKQLNEQYGRNKWQGKPLDENFADKLVESFTRNALEERAQKRSEGRDYGLTGEYIIFGKTKAGNRYLWLAAHTDPHEEIWPFVEQEVSEAEISLDIA